MFEVDCASFIVVKSRLLYESACVDTTNKVRGSVFTASFHNILKMSIYIYGIS